MCRSNSTLTREMMSNKNKYSEEIGLLIRKARKEVGLSQKDFAVILNVSDKTVSSYEVGRSVPSIQVLGQMSKIVQKPIGYFTGTMTEDMDLQLKLNKIEGELLEIKKILKSRK